MLLHSVYSAKHDNVDCIIIFSSDTDVIVSCIYYASTLLRDLPQIWVQTNMVTLIPVHEMAAALWPSRCKALPFIHSISGRDTTSFPFFTGKKNWIMASKTLNLTSIEAFAETTEEFEITG